MVSREPAGAARRETARPNPWHESVDRSYCRGLVLQGNAFPKPWMLDYEPCGLSGTPSTIQTEKGQVEIDMQATQVEVLDLLRAWGSERRLLQCNVIMGQMRARVLGHIDNIQSSYVYISAKSLEGTAHGDKFFVDIPFHGAAYEYVEGRDAPELYLRTAIEQTFKGLLGITYESGLKIAINVYKSDDELQ